MLPGRYPSIVMMRRQAAMGSTAANRMCRFAFGGVAADGCDGMTSWTVDRCTGLPDIVD
ncbi:hypothetical protein GCM10027176_62430 [Actinoallomurus bryophytorum]